MCKYTSGAFGSEGIWEFRFPKEESIKRKNFKKDLLSICVSSREKPHTNLDTKKEDKLNKGSVYTKKSLSVSELFLIYDKNYVNKT